MAFPRFAKDKFASAFPSMEVWRFLDMGPQDAATAIGRMPVLAARVSQGQSANLLMTSIWSRAHLNIGWFEDVDAVADVEKCGELGVDLVRRPVLGGGTAFYDAYCSAFFSFFMQPERFPSLDAALTFFQPVLRRMLDEVRLTDVQFEGSSDLRWRGRKLGALISQSVMGCTIVGAFINLAGPNIDLYLKVAHVPDEKFADKAVKDMAEYIVTPKEIMGRQLAYGEIRDAIARAFRAVTGWSLQPQPLTPEEERGIREFADMVSAESWIRHISSRRFAAEAPAGSQVGFANHKGKKLVRAGVAVGRDEKIVAAMFAGDMHISPPDIMERTAQALVGLACADVQGLRDRISSVLRSPEVKQADALLGITPDDCLTAVMAAVAAAKTSG